MTKPPKTWWSRTWKIVASWHPKGKLSEKEWKVQVTRTVYSIWKDLPDAVKESLEYGFTQVKNTELPCPKCNTLNPVSRMNVTLKCRKCGKGLIAVKVKGR
jgi:phage FluMu protein Com